MKYDYKYDDPDHLYTYKTTGVLRNKLGIDDEQQLLATESFEVGVRLFELRRKPIQVKTADTIFAIHGYLFQDLYDWAGKVRTVQISKQGNQFLPTDRFAEGFSYIDDLLVQYRSMGDDVHSLAKKLAEILDALNYLHPFREGNGRAQREFIRVLALEKGYRLDLNPADDNTVYERYMIGTAEGEIDMLTELIESIIL